jgi:hypothetical protein
MDQVIKLTSQLLLPFYKEMTMMNHIHKEEKTSAKKASMKTFTGLLTHLLRLLTGKGARNHLSQMDLTQKPSSSININITINKMISPKKELMRTSIGSQILLLRHLTGREAKSHSFQMDPTQKLSSFTKEKMVIFQRQE